MPAIELRQIEAAFSYAATVYDGELGFEQAASRLRDDHELNINSARDFIVQYRCMMKGEAYKRTQSALALSHFLPRILRTRGRAAAENAVAATWLHIAYYETLQKTYLLKLRQILTGFESGLTGAVSQHVHESRLSAAIAESLRDTAAARKARLASAQRVPEQVPATTVIYKRNQDVVAEVLLRAAGTCELCNSAAPFSRRSDNTPYLEVHHRVQLAHGGEDTVENAIAVCPNCHRREHFA